MRVAKCSENGQSRTPVRTRFDRRAAHFTRAAAPGLHVMSCGVHLREVPSMAQTKRSSRSSAGRSHGRRSTSSSKRELINTGRDKRYVRRDTQGQFKESDDVGKS